MNLAGQLNVGQNLIYDFVKNIYNDVKIKMLSYVKGEEEKTKSWIDAITE